MSSSAPAHPNRRTADRQTWETPQALFDLLDAEFGFTLDPCAEPETAKCARYYTAADDGLAQSWAGEVVFCNPPYGDKAAWVRKAWTEAAEHGALVVLLIPACTDTRLARDFCRFGEQRFITGRLKFDGGRTAAPFASSVVIFRPGQGRERPGRWHLWGAWPPPGDNGAHAGEAKIGVPTRGGRARETF